MSQKERYLESVGGAAHQSAVEIIERLEAALAEDRAVCLCGCSADEHENYGEEGEACGNDDHECIRVCVAAGQIVGGLRFENARLTAENEALKSAQRHSANSSAHNAQVAVDALSREWAGQEDLDTAKAENVRLTAELARLSGACEAVGTQLVELARPNLTDVALLGTPPLDIDGDALVDERSAETDARLKAETRVTALEGRFDLLLHLQRQQEWSERTFGPGVRAEGVVDHIVKELAEILADPSDLTEWIDVAILALDGAWRSGASPEQIVAALVAKQAKNEARTWPDWRTAEPGKAIQHVRVALDAGGKG
jgi:hypothetical protein